MQKRNYKVKNLALPFKRAYGVIIGLGSAFFLFNLVFSNGFLGFISIFLGLIAALILCGTLFLMFGFEAIEINFTDQSWIYYTNLLGLKAGTQKCQAGFIQSIIVSEIEYRDDVTPLNANDVFYVVYILYDDQKQVVLETSHKQAALARAKEMAQLWSVDFEIAAHLD